MAVGLDHLWMAERFDGRASQIHRIAILHNVSRGVLGGKRLRKQRMTITSLRSAVDAGVVSHTFGRPFPTTITPNQGVFETS